MGRGTCVATGRAGGAGAGRGGGGDVTRVAAGAQYTLVVTFSGILSLGENVHILKSIFSSFFLVLTCCGVFFLVDNVHVLKSIFFLR